MGAGSRGRESTRSRGYPRYRCVCPSPRDHALLYSAASVMTVTPLVQDNLPFVASRDFVPISPTCSAVFVLGINNDFHPAALNDVSRIANSHPANLLWSSTPRLRPSP